MYIKVDIIINLLSLAYEIGRRDGEQKRYGGMREIFERLQEVLDFGKETEREE